MTRAEALIALALQFCPWQPEPLPKVYIAPDQEFEVDLINLKSTLPLDSRGYFIEIKFLGTPLKYIVLRESTANERILCHEMRHVVEPEWRHE